MSSQLHTIFTFIRTESIFSVLRKKVKVEFQDDSGARYTLAVEGRLSRDKVMKIMDLMELVEGTESIPRPALDQSSTFNKVLKMVEESYSSKEFSSADIARDYEELHNEPISLSTVATYLSRMADRGYLGRQKFGNSWVYRRTYLHANQLPK